MLAETLTALAFVLVKGGELLGSVTGGNAKEETAVGSLSSVAARLAITSGCWKGTTTAPVPSAMSVVCAAM